MNNKDFISSLSSVSDHSVRDTQILVNSLVLELTSILEDDNALTVPGFGTFEVKKKLEKVLLNPATGQRMLVPPKLVLNFKVSNALRERIQKGGDE